MMYEEQTDITVLEEEAVASDLGPDQGANHSSLAWNRYLDRHVSRHCVRRCRLEPCRLSQYMQVPLDLSIARRWMSQLSTQTFDGWKSRRGLPMPCGVEDDGQASS